MKPETKFRQSVFIPFLKKLKNTHFFPIQQVAISGTPDFILCSRGKFVACELKSEFGELSELQKYSRDQVIRTDGIYLTIRPNNWKYAKEYLTALDAGVETGIYL